MKPRVDAGIRAGSKRSIGATDVWVPLAQDNDQVVYFDGRLMGDDDDNREGNLGFGYRTVAPGGNAVLGTHGWIDRRVSERGSTIYQFTAGAEYLGNDFDLRTNAYIPLSPEKRWRTPNTGQTNPYLAGNGIYVDTAGVVIEEPQPGFDAEMGVPIKWDAVDAMHVYAGIYHFHGSDTPSVSGPRARLLVDVTPDISLGATIQTDKPRGDQAFLNATIRLPFHAKRGYKADGIRARLDEAPERDIDIVSGTYVDTGRLKPAINANTDQVQRVLYVDNTAVPGGDGSLEKPFDTLQAAENILADHDILYIAHGDGTTTGQNEGIVIARNDVMVLGAGTNFVWNDNLYTAPPNGNSYTGTLLKAATANPVLTNTAGDGIYITGRNTTVAGLTVDYATGNGISFMADTGTDLGTVTAYNVSTNHNGNDGLYALAIDGGHIDSVDFHDAISTYNTRRGIGIESAELGSTIDNASISHSLSDHSGERGIMISSWDNGHIETADIQHNTATYNTGFGIQLEADNTNGYLGTAHVTDNIVNHTPLTALRVDATRGAVMDDVTVSDNTVTDNTTRGIGVEASAGTSRINNVLIENNVTTGNIQQGLIAFASIGEITNLTVRGNTSNNNTNRGIQISATSAGRIGTVDLINNTANNNTTTAAGEGIRVEYSGAGSTIGTANLTGNITNSNALYGTNVVGGTNAALGTLTIDNETATGNNNIGIYVRNNTGSDVTNATIKNSNASGNLTTNGRGITVEFNGAGSTLGTLTYDNNVTNANASYGTYIIGLGGGTIGAASMTGNTSSNNTGTNGRGIQVEAQSATSAITSVTMTNNTTNGNAIQGTQILANLGTIGTASVDSLTATGNSNSGLYVRSTGSASYINNLTVKNSDLSGNLTSTGRGATITTDAAGSINTALIDHNKFNGNVASGLYVFANTGVINNTTISRNTATANTLNGIYIDDDTTGAFSVSMGNTAVTGSGGNRVYGNTGTDMRVDLDGAATKAENNYWGGGALTRITYDSGTVAANFDATPFLTTDPGP